MKSFVVTIFCALLLPNVGGRLVQIVAPQLNVPLTIDDLRKLPRSKKQAAGRKIIQKELLHSFDLARGPLIRTRLVRLAPEEHLLLIAMHQINVDGSSLGVISNELAGLYDNFAAGSTSTLPPLDNSICRFCGLAAAMAITSEYRRAVRLLARAASRAAPDRDIRRPPSWEKGRPLPNSAMQGGVAGKSDPSTQGIQPSRRRHFVHGVGCRLKDTVASPLERK